jgi:hypothetical protein
MLYLQQKATFNPSAKVRRIKPLWSQRTCTLHIDIKGNSGDPIGLFLLEEYGVQTIQSEETKRRYRESDSSVVRAWQHVHQVG